MHMRIRIIVCFVMTRIIAILRNRAPTRTHGIPSSTFPSEGRHGMPASAVKPGSATKAIPPVISGSRAAALTTICSIEFSFMQIFMQANMRDYFSSWAVI
ncbi:hypothetical protein UE98_15040 [Burkholderia cenocepacia]|nr:hypothetical protein UE98_15040 [Burkholderia cenocepacia]